MSAARQLEAPSPRCEICSVPVAIASTGRPRRYCSDRCKQKAARNRRTLIETLTSISLIRLDVASALWIDQNDDAEEEHRVA